MNFPRFFGNRKIRPTWSYRAAGVIWRILISDAGDLALEIRDEDAKKTSFSFLDGANGVPRWSDLMLEEPWWVGMEAIQGNILFLHKYAKHDSPEHRGIIAVDASRGVILWSQENLAFLQGNGDRVYAFTTQFERRIVHLVDALSGSILETFDENSDDVERLRTVPRLPGIAERMGFPATRAFDSLNAKLQAKIRGKVRMKNLVEPVEHLEMREFSVIGYYQRTPAGDDVKPMLRNTLAILDTAGRLIFEEVLQEGVRGAVPESFFSIDGRVYALRNRNSIISLELWKS
jgi:hypothetical protein